MTAARLIGAIGGALLQVVVGLALVFLSIDSIGLVTDDDFSLNWWLAVPAFVVIATAGFTGARIMCHPRWLLIGTLTTVLAIGVALLSSLALGSVAAGALSFLTVQILVPFIASANLLPADGPQSPAPGPTS